MTVKKRILNKIWEMWASSATVIIGFGVIYCGVTVSMTAFTMNTFINGFGTIHMTLSAFFGATTICAGILCTGFYISRKVKK